MEGKSCLLNAIAGVAIPDPMKTKNPHGLSPCKSSDSRLLAKLVPTFEDKSLVKGECSNFLILMYSALLFACPLI
jgi:hypothetical protein